MYRSSLSSKRVCLIQNTQEVKESTFQLDKTGQNVWIFEEVLFVQATYNRKTNLEENDDEGMLRVKQNEQKVAVLD